jgi:hypothetical protein
LACPFFFPTERAYDIALPHPARLPLGAAWRGRCDAPGCAPQSPGNQELESCNLGYALKCPRLPSQRACDAIRFGVTRESGSSVSLQYVMEAAHQPAGHGLLEYDRVLGSWSVTHPEVRVQKMAECFLQSYLERSRR